MQYCLLKKDLSLLRKQGPEPCVGRLCHNPEGRAHAQHREPSSAHGLAQQRSRSPSTALKPAQALRHQHLGATGDGEREVRGIFGGKSIKAKERKTVSYSSSRRAMGRDIVP